MDDYIVSTALESCGGRLGEWLTIFGSVVCDFNVDIGKSSTGQVLEDWFACEACGRETLWVRRDERIDMEQEEEEELEELVG